MQITAFGAAQTVTGSCHLVEQDTYRLLLDCGVFQGGEEDRNDEPFGFDVHSIDAVLLSHAHNDHIGRLPLLVKQGYRGPIFGTQATLEILPIILQDSLHLRTEERERLLKKGKQAPPLLWDEADLSITKELLQPVGMMQYLNFGPLKVRLSPAGHLPGSAFIEIEHQDQRLVFSGDLGHQHKEVLPDAVPCKVADLVLCESTYGDRSHKSFEDTLEEFKHILQTTLQRGGKVMIPGFALERTQEILFYIRQLEDQKAIPIVPVYVDSPMAHKVSEVYEDLPEFFSEEVQELFYSGRNPFAPLQLRYTQSVDESKALNEASGPMIVIAGNGMLSGGRILHHLRHGLPEAKNALIIAGYQPRGGIGQLLIDGASEIRIFGKTVSVAASCHTLGGFSGHAGQDELLQWLQPHKNIVLVHGEVQKMNTLAKHLSAQGKTVRQAEWGVPIEV